MFYFDAAYCKLDFNNLNLSQKITYLSSGCVAKKKQSPPLPRAITSIDYVAKEKRK